MQNHPQRCLSFCFACPFHFVYTGINHSHGRYIDNISNRRFEVGKVYGAVQAHLYWSNNLCFGVERLQKLVACVGAAKVGEH